jgi:hypothetical protein
MGSKQLVTKELQKARFSELAEARAAILKEQGHGDKEIARDSKLKHLKARIKQVKGAMTRIAFLEDQKARLLERREQRKAEEAAEKAAERSGVKKVKEKAEEKKAAPAGKKQAKAKPAGGGEKKDAKKKGK